MKPIERELLSLLFWVVGSGVASAVVGMLWRRVVVPVTRRTRTKFDAHLAESASGVVPWAVLAVGWYLGASAAFSATADPTVARWSAHVVWRVCKGALYVNLVLALTVLVYAVLRGMVRWYAEAFAERTRTTLDDQAVTLFQRFAKLVFLFIALTIIFKHFNVEITGILATAGVASLAVALAAQDTLANMISGIILMFDRPFKRGDRITLPSGEWGDVLDIGLRSTKVLSLDQTVIVIPNAEIAKSQVVNHSAPNPQVKVRHTVGVAYGTDMNRVKGILREILHAQADILDDPPPDVFFTEFADSSLNVLIIFWIDDYRDRFRILDEVNMTIKERFEAEGIEIPFPQRDVYVRAMAAPEKGS